MIALLFAIIFASANTVACWQLVDELCQTTKIAELLKDGHWCSKSVPRCQWQGISCDGEGFFTNLELDSVPLNVRLPMTLDAPGARAQVIKMRNCGLFGEMPGTIASTNLHTLDLAHNQIEGTLPWDWVAGRYRVDVSYNRMAGKSSLAQQTYPYMRHLCLAGNKFRENLNEWSGNDVPIMQTFDISSNQFVGRAPAFGGAELYNISNNFFSDIEELPADFEVPFGNLLPLRKPLRNCDMSNNLFRLAPPRWVEPHYERCLYRYDPSNPIKFEHDFEPTTTSTEASDKTVGGGDGASSAGPIDQSKN